MDFQGAETVELTGIEDRDYQLEVAADLLDNPQRNTVVQGDVGLGKTETVLMEMAARSNRQDGDYSAMVVVPNERLEQQWYERIQDYDTGFDVRTNEPANENRLGRLQRAIPDHKKKERLEDYFEGSGFEERKQRNIRNSDVFITTYQLLASDIKNDRLNDLNMDFDEIIVDEATHMLSHLTMKDADELNSFVPGYKVDERFQKFADAFAGSRMVGLTAVPDAKLNHMLDIFNADVVSPAEEKAREYMQDVDVQPHTFQDEAMDQIAEMERLEYSSAVHHFQNAVHDEYRARPDPQKAYQFIGDENDHVEAAVKKLMKAQTRLAKVSESVAYPSVDGWEVTPKGEYLEAATGEMVADDEQYLAFATHVATTENIAKLAQGDVAVVTGQNKKEENRERIDRYRDGDLDGLVMTYGAGGEGLDLGETDNVVHMSSYVPQNRRLSATGRGKRQDGVTEHTLRYSFEPGISQPTVEFRGQEPAYTEETMDEIQSILSDDSGPDSIGWTDIQ